MKTALRIALIYLVAGVLWILFSDLLVSALFQNPAGYRAAQTYKGWFFVVVSTVLIFSLVKSRMTRIHEATRARRISENALQDLYENAPVGIFQSTPEGRYLRANAHLARMLGWDSPEQLISEVKSIPDQVYVDPSERKTVLDLLQEREALTNVESQRKKRDGTVIWTSTNMRAIRDQTGAIHRLEGFTQDITDRKQAEAEQHKLADRLKQSQKMEAIGRLAGGVAHDFNNMLQVILGYADTLLESSPDLDQATTESLNTIRQAAEHSSQLTKQLLAFARKQTISPRRLDLNAVVESSSRMLGRLIGEHIELIRLPATDLWGVTMDPVQIDQILANLAINARDAMVDGGRLTIETQNVVIDEQSCTGHPDCRSGEYVRLSISDNGAGMPREVQQQAFEPFFTTKEGDGGTGLGLATVYGIVTQNNGFIELYSELDQGTTFKIYLPRSLSDEPIHEVKPDPPSPASGNETVMIVEDRPEVLNLCQDMIQSLGYTVLTAEGPGTALRLAREYPEEIHLLLTDVIMPEMSGKELIGHMRNARPNIRCLFMSGYTSNIIAHHGVLDPGIHFIEKPFTRSSLGKKIREALEDA